LRLSAHSGNAITILVRLTLIALWCGSLSACAIVASAAIGLAVQGAAAIAIYPVVAGAEAEERERCMRFAGEDIEVTGSPELMIPPEEGARTMFAPSDWRAHWRGERKNAFDATFEHAPAATVGTLVITERAVWFLPTLGAPGVRIPLPAVANVELEAWTPLSDSGTVVVGSCGNRFDTFSFSGKRDANKPETEAAKVTALLKARIAAARSVDRSSSWPPQPEGTRLRTAAPLE
jgi:hypothetical protein